MLNFTSLFHKIINQYCSLIWLGMKNYRTHAFRSCCAEEFLHKVIIIRLPIRDGIFDVVACSVNEHPTVIPSSWLHTCVLMNGAEGLQPTVADVNSVFSQQSHVGHVSWPHNIPTFGNLDLCQSSDGTNLGFKHRSQIYNYWLKRISLKQSKTGTSTSHKNHQVQPVAYPGILFGEGSTNSVEDREQRERGSGGGCPLVSGSEGSCNLVQEISFHIQ